MIIVILIRSQKPSVSVAEVEFSTFTANVRALYCSDDEVLCFQLIN